MVNFEEMSQEAYKSSSKSFEISYSFHQTQFGKCLLGLRGKSVCHLSFVDDSEEKALEYLQDEWPGAALKQDNRKDTGKLVKRIFSPEYEASEDDDTTVLLRGTEFQMKVWKTLTELTKGEVVTYEAVAEKLGNAKAIRAAANALARNRVGYLIPCHRVISKSGANKYQWGVDRKQRIQKFEAENA